MFESSILNLLIDDLFSTFALICIQLHNHAPEHLQYLIHDKQNQISKLIQS